MFQLLAGIILLKYKSSKGKYTSEAYEGDFGNVSSSFKRSKMEGKRIE